MKRIYLYLLAAAILCVAGVFIAHDRGAQQQKNAPAPAISSHDGRDFRSLSLHPNAEEMVFVECSETLATRCAVLRYHLRTQHLQYYDLPPGYAYHAANISPKGTYIVIKRVPLWEGSEMQVRTAFEHAELAIMKLDGSDFRVLPLAEGPKAGPVMSNHEDKVAYWRSKLRKPGSKTFATDFDIWEVDVKTGDERLFAGPFQFFEASQMQYMPTDQEILVGAYAPTSDGRNSVDTWSYDEKYRGSAVYQLSRGQPILSAPLFSEKVMGANMPTMDHLGNIYYEGGLPGIYLFKADASGSAQQLVKTQAFHYIQNLVATPKGDFLVFIYNAPGSDYREPKSDAIGRLDTVRSEWQKISIPKLDTASAITVHSMK